MSHVTFDTLKFVETLKQSGMPENQAKAIAEAQAEAFSQSLNTTLASKDDMYEIKSDIKLMKWMLGFVLASNAAIILKLFF